MLSDLTGMALFLGYFVAAASSALLIKKFFNLPFELLRKLLHMVIVLSIFPLLNVFSTWYMAVLAALLLVALAYPLLALVENTAFFRRVAPERKVGEFKRSLIIVQVMFSLLLFIFWGVLGPQWRYVAVAAVMAWGFGDAAAALVGKAFGRRRIQHRWVEGSKTVEGTQAMYVVAALAVFFTLLLYGNQPGWVSLVVALLAAPVCALVELFSHRGMDTITVPISAGLAMLILMSIFSSLGI